MKEDNEGHIIAECSRCHFQFDTLFGLSCPRCDMTAHTENVRKAYAPIDPLRTALGIKAVRERWQQLWESHGVRWHGPVPAGRGHGMRVVLDNVNEEAEQAEDIPGMPKTEEEQIWKLCRLFRK